MESDIAAVKRRLLYHTDIRIWDPLMKFASLEIQNTRKLLDVLEPESYYYKLTQNTLMG